MRSKSCIPLLLFLFSCFASFGHDLPPGFAAVEIATGLDPVSMALAPDGRIFFIEKNGRISIVENGEMLPDAFYEVPVDNYNERGLSGIAVDPDFGNSPYVYFYYTVPGKDHNRIARVRADGYAAVPGSEETLLDLPEMAGSNHNAGAMIFGDDGKLYVAIGDGTSLTVSQDLETVLGKILRINKDGSIPTDNPFYTQTSGDQRAIWALGVRNPFALCKQSGTGRIFSTDVGSAYFEELNEIIKGHNYGWPQIEGMLTNQVAPANYKDPLHAYDHNTGCAIVGVAAYNPEIELFPSEYVGKIFYTDYCKGFINTYDLNTGDVETFADDINRPLNILTAPDGTLYFIARAGIQSGDPVANTASENGSLWRIFYTGSDAPFVSIQPKDQTIANGEGASFQADAAGNGLSFQWQKGGIDLMGQTNAMLDLSNQTLIDNGSQFRCIISNSFGIDTTKTATLTVIDGNRPVVDILSPLSDYTYRAGDSILLAGIATDVEDGMLDASTFRWKIEFHHDTHTHPAFGPVNGADSIMFVIPKIGEVADNVWYRINLWATDNSGLLSVDEQLIYPVKTNFTVKTDPPGLSIQTDARTSNTPYLVNSVVGIIHEIRAPWTVVIDETLYLFDQWSTGSTENPLLYDTPDTATIVTAHYLPVKPVDDGVGLRATYYNDNGNRIFDEEPLVTQIDSIINFEWGLDQPHPLINSDDFLVRWEGYIVPFLDDTISFHVITDDGARLWVNNEMVMQAWWDQGPSEHSGSIYLEQGKYYPIRLEYYENVGGGTCKMLWSGNRLGRDLVPSSQLFPPADTIVVEDLTLTIYPNPVRDQLTVEIESPNASNLSVEVYNLHWQFIQTSKLDLMPGTTYHQVPLENMSAGVYFLKIKDGAIDQTIPFYKQ